MSQEELDFDAKRGGELVKEWFVKVICPSLGEEGFDECYTRVMDESYECPGDDYWYSYREPQGSFSRGSVLSILRPTFAKRYFSEERANVATVADAAERYKYQRLSLFLVSILILTRNTKVWQRGARVCH